MLPSPNTTFAFIVATLYGAIFHLIFGGDARRLALFLLSGWIGFGLGHVFGVIFDISIFNIGTLRLVTATLGALVALVAAYFFTSKTTQKRVSR
jgi:hypothetical protein